jgi:hypothetical protein
VAVVIASLHAWHFFHAVDGHATLAFALAGLAGLVLRRWLRPTWPFGPAATALWILGVVWLANRSTGPCDQFDSLIYHLHATEWTHAYPVVPGLGNLHTRLGLNNSSFLLAALLEPGPLNGQSPHLLNGFIVAALWTQLVHCLSRLARREPIHADDAFLVVVAYPLLNDASHYRISSLGTDLPSYAFIFVSIWSFLVSLRVPDSARWQLAAATFALISVCMKITAVPFAALLIAAIVVRWVKAERPLLLRRGAQLTIIACAILGPWMIRGIVLTGHPIYPLPLFKTAFEWTVPEEISQSTRDYSRDFARTDGYLTEFHTEPVPAQWLRAWILRQIRFAKADTVVPAAVFLISAVGLALNRGRSRCELDLILSLVAAVVVWFVHAPLVRFGMGVLWSAAAATAAFVMASSSLQRQRLMTGFWLVFACATLMLPLVRRGGVVASVSEPTIGLLVPAAHLSLFHQPRRRAAMQTFHTASGLAVEVPRQGTGGWHIVVMSPVLAIGQPLVNASCWTGNLVRTPYPNPGLALRNPMSLADGFVVRPVENPGQWLKRLE